MTNAPVDNAPKHSRMRGSEIGGLVFVTVFTIGIIALGWQITANTIKASAYHRAIPCTSGTSATGNCISYQTMRVISKDFVDNDDMPDNYYLGLQDGKTILPRVEVDGGLYEVISSGSVVSVKFWRGEAMIVTGGGTRSGTDNHPDRENHRDWVSIVIFGLGEWLFVHIYLSERRRRIRNSIPDVPWVATHLMPTRFQQWEVMEDSTTLTMTRWPHNSPTLFLCLSAAAILVAGYCLIYFSLHPAETEAYIWPDTIVEVVLIVLAFGCWSSNRRETNDFERGTLPQLQFARGETLVLRNQEPLGEVLRIYLEEQVYGDGRGMRLNVAAGNGEIIHLGGAEANDLAAIRPFATHLAAFLDLPLEFTKEEKPGSN